jgi:hypothetical protein
MPEDSGPNAAWGIGWYCKNTASSLFENNTMISFMGNPQFHYVWSIPSPELDFKVGGNRWVHQLVGD